MGIFDSISSLFSDITAPVASLLGSGISGAASLIGGMNQSSSAAASIAQQENYQTQMSDTAYQRSTADLKAAGLNPMLAYTNGGASTPSGGSFMPPNIAGNAVNSAADAFSSISSSINNLSSAASTKASLPSKTLSNTIPDLINTGVSKLKNLLTNSASSPLASGSISSSDLPSFDSAPSSAQAAGHDGTGASETGETDWLTQLTDQTKQGGVTRGLHKALESIGEWNPYGL